MALESVKTLFENLRRSFADFMTEKWERVLPLDEMAADRWKKAEILSFGKGTNIYENSYVYGRPKVGKDTWIGPFTILDGTGGLKIGDGCSIASGVHIYTHAVHEWVASEGNKPKTKDSVDIGNFVSLGANAVVLPGVTIGDHTIVGAGSVVTKSIPGNSVAVGVPAAVVKRIESE